MQITVVTSLYPSPPRPREGVFAEERWLRMATRGHEIRVIQPVPLAPPLARGAWGEIASMPSRESRGGIAIRRPRYLHLPGRALGNARRFARRAAGLLGSPEVVVCDYAWPAAAIAPELRARGVSCVINGRGSDVLEVSGEAGLGTHLSGFLQAAGSWCAVSRDLVENMDRLAEAPGRGRLVPNGVDTERFHPRDRAACREAVGAPVGPLVLVVGHLIPRKDPLLALEVFLEGAPAGAHLWFLGRGPLEQDLAMEIEARGAGDRVRLLGEVSPDELSMYYGSADLLLLTSRREGRPNVVLEALASGLPVLATRAGGTAEILGESPMLMSNRDPETLGGALGGLLDEPPSREELASMVSGLSWEASLDALEAVLEEAVMGRTAVQS